MTTRADVACRPMEIGVTALTQKTCVSDAIHLWNSSPKSVTESKSVYQAKKEIKLRVGRMAKTNIKCQIILNYIKRVSTQ